MDSYISEIRIFAGNFAPREWMFCQGQTLSISEYTPLYALIGTMYGGDGVQTFKLPDLRGRTVIGPGQGPGLPTYIQGQVSGSESVVLTSPYMPSHTHSVLSLTNVAANASMKALSTAGGGDNPSGAYPALQADNYGTAPSTPSTTRMAAQPVTGTLSATLSATGGNQPIAIRSPYLAMNFIIAVEGIFPSRN